MEETYSIKKILKAVDTLIDGGNNKINTMKNRPQRINKEINRLSKNEIPIATDQIIKEAEAYFQDIKKILKN